MVLVLAVAALIQSGCASFQSRYFRRYGAQEASIEQYSLAPRIFACQDEMVEQGDTTCDNYSVSIRVVEESRKPVRDAWKQDMATIDSLSEAFFEEVAGVFRTDSLVLREEGETESIVLRPETDRYTPRRDNYFTLRFGSTDISLENGQLRVVLHVSRAGEKGHLLPDSIVWLMESIDSTDYGINMFRNSVRGYE